MKYRTIALFFVAASLFLLFATQQAVSEKAGATVTLRIPNLPCGG